MLLLEILGILDKMTLWKHWKYETPWVIARGFKIGKYKNLTLFFGSLLLVVFLRRVGVFEEIVSGLGDFGYIGAFFAGMMGVLTFTVSFGVVLLLELAGNLTIWEVGLIAGIGAVFGDFLIFRFVRGGLLKEIEPLYNQFGRKYLNHLLCTKYFSWTLPFVGALIVASPLPDELGVTLMGISRLKTWQFVLISFALNVFGITLILFWATFGD